MARDISGSANGLVGTAVVQVLEENGDRVLLVIQADSGNSGKIYVRFDGVDPTATNYHTELVAGGGLVLDGGACPAGAVKVVGSTSGLRYSVLEA